MAQNTVRDDLYDQIASSLSGLSMWSLYRNPGFDVFNGGEIPAIALYKGTHELSNEQQAGISRIIELPEFQLYADKSIDSDLGKALNVGHAEIISRVLPSLIGLSNVLNAREADAETAFFDQISGLGEVATLTFRIEVEFFHAELNPRITG